MLVFIGPLAAVVVSLATPGVRHHHPRRVHALRRAHAIPRDASTMALRRTAAQIARLALLQRRQALLHEFLMRANTETPLFRDASVRMPVPGLLVSSTFVSLDLIGSPIIRARVTNRQPTIASIVLTANLTDAKGLAARASVAFVLQPAETRTVELLCPSGLVPISLRWSAVAL